MGRQSDNRLWSSEEDNLLMEMRRRRRKWDAIGASLGLPPTTCRTRYYYLIHRYDEAERALPPPPPKAQRMCMKCRSRKVRGWSYCESCRKRLHDFDTPYAE